MEGREGRSPWGTVAFGSRLLGDALGEPRLLAGGAVLVNQALRGCHIDALLCLAKRGFSRRRVARLGCCDRLFGSRFQLGSLRLVGGASLLVLAIALDLGLDVGH